MELMHIYGETKFYESTHASKNDTFQMLGK